jgi:hypothetical protein
MAEATRMFFYSTKAQEKVADADRQKEIDEVYARLNEREKPFPGLSKYRPEAHLGGRPITFRVVDGVVIGNDGQACPDKKQRGGQVYQLVPKFSESVLAFQKRHNRYKASISTARLVL